MIRRKMRLIAVAGLVFMLTWVLVGGAVAAKPEAAGAPPEIARGVFVNDGFSSPTWYPPEEDTDSYRWAPRIYWAVPSIGVLVNPTASPFGAGEFDDVVTEVAKGFAAWNDVDTNYSAAVSRDDEVSPSLEDPDGVNTVSWGTMDGAGGTIAVCYFWYWVNTKELIDCDIIFDLDEPWSISEEVPGYALDVRNIATHEAGHTLVLGDLRSPKDGALTMHAYTWLGDDVKRTLGSGDSLGIEAIYGD